MTASELLTQLYSLDTQSSGFLRVLYAFIRTDKEEDYSSTLQGPELAELVNFLDKVRPPPPAFWPRRKREFEGPLLHPHHRRRLPTMFDQAASHLRHPHHSAIFTHHRWRSEKDRRKRDRVWRLRRCVAWRTRGKESLYQGFEDRPERLRGPQEGPHPLSVEIALITEHRLWALQSFFKEAVVWKRLRHSNIVPFLGVTTEPLQFVSEWMPNGILTDYVTKHPGADRIALVSPTSSFLLDHTQPTPLSAVGCRRRAQLSSRYSHDPRGPERGMCLFQ